MPKRCGDFLAEDTCAAHLDPADAFDIHFGIEARLGVGIVRGLEPHALKAHPVVELAEDPEQVPERDTLVHHDPLELLELGKVRGVDRLAPVDPADAEGLDGRVRVLCKVLDGEARRVGPEHALLGLLLLPGAAPAGRGCVPAGDVHRLHLLVPLREGEGLAEVEGVLHLPGRVVLRLEEGVEVPEGLLDDAAVEFRKSHLEEDLPHLRDDPLVGMDLAGIRLLRELGHIDTSGGCGSSTHPERICSRVRVPVSSRRSRPFFASAKPSGVMAMMYRTVSDSCRIPRLISSFVWGSPDCGISVMQLHLRQLKHPSIFYTEPPFTRDETFFPQAGQNQF